ncbi:MAG: zinc ribbon domain-containing protein [Candidatus Methanomethylicia archaeon]|nr:zinc ribbon domain-containing protein [Candidatus Methanomethylicia archaeon]
MSSGNEGLLTLTIKMRVSPEPEYERELISLMKRYRDALNYAIKVVIENKALSLSKIHKLLYSILKEKYGLPSKIAQDCYREAIAIAKSWIRNPKKEKIPTIKTLRMWLTLSQGYRIKDNYVEIIGGYKLRIIGWDRRYDKYQNREARLTYKNGKMFLMITKRIPKPSKYTPRGVLAIDVNEKHIVVGNSHFEYRFETAIERALHYKQLAENLQEKYSSTRYNAWLRRRGIRKRIRYFHKKTKNIIEDCVKKISHKITILAKHYQYAIAREELTGLVESFRKLPKEYRVGLIILSYRRLKHWIDWQCEKNGVPLIIVDPKGTSITCPRCNSKLVKNGYRKMRYLKCRFEADRDIVAVQNIERKAKMWGALIPLNAPQMTDVIPNR